MNTKLSDAISIVEFGNILTKNHTAKNRLKDSMMQYIESIRFIVPEMRFFSSKISETEYASHLDEWYNKLLTEGCYGFRLVRLSGTKSAWPKSLFTTFEHENHGWCIETLLDNHSAFWFPCWLPNTNPTKSRKRWCIKYFRSRKVKSPLFHSSLKKAREELIQKLIEINSFAEENSLNNFTGGFQGALLQLSYDGNPLRELPMSELAKRTLDAVRQAYAFGGMGSLNDQYFQSHKTDQKFQILTSELYAAMETAIIAATDELSQNH